VNEEHIYILILSCGGICFALGGMAGGRIIRRYVLPLGLGIGAFFLDQDLWRCIAFALTLSFSLHLGYGENSSYFKKIMVFTLYVASTLFFGFTIWQIFTPYLIFMLFVLSNSVKFAKQFKWKVCEFLMGVLIAVTLIGAIK